MRHQSIPIQSMSADIFTFKEDIFVAMAAPNSNSCVIMEWDHIEMNFRKLDNITGAISLLLLHVVINLCYQNKNKSKFCPEICLCFNTIPILYPQQGSLLLDAGRS